MNKHTELIKRLREHSDERLYEEADLLMSEAANALQAENAWRNAALRLMTSSVNAWKTGWQQANDKLSALEGQEAVLYANSVMNTIAPTIKVTGDAYSIPLYLAAGAVQPVSAAVPNLTDEEIISLNKDDKYFSTSESKYGRENNPFTQYHTGEPGYVQFVRDILASIPQRESLAAQPLDETSVADPAVSGPFVPGPAF